MRIDADKLTLDKVLCLILTIPRVNDTLDDMKIKLTLTLSFTRNHVLFKLFWVFVLAAVIIHVVLDWALVVVVQFADAFIGRCCLVVFPC